MVHHRRAESRPRSRAVDVVLGGVLDIAIITVTLLGSFLLYGFVIMPELGNRYEAQAADQLERSWNEAPPLQPLGEQVNPEGAGAPDTIGEEVAGTGQTFATMTIPKLGANWRYTVISGVTIPDLRTGVGWYPGTSLPGEMGNFATAAHRDGSTAPYMHIDQLSTCDDIHVNTQDGSYTYRVVPVDGSAAEANAFAACAPHAPDTMGVPGLHITSPDDVSVLYSTPTSNEPANQPWMTLTSCHPRLSSAQRIVVHAVLTDFTPRTSA